MSVRSDRVRLLKLLRILFTLSGVVLIAVAIFADILGFGEAGSFGIGQILLTILGVLILFGGFLGKSFMIFYQGMAVILINTILLFGILELSVIAIARLGLIPTYTDITFSRYLDIPYYRERDWSEAYWGEAGQAESYQYQPYVVWRHRKFEGTLVNVNQDGFRFTPGAECTAESFTIYTFGGSSMWGWGSPDWGTIAAYLQTGLDEIIEGPVCVINMGEDAYVSTQSLVALILQLQKGNVPDIVIFVDGINDVYGAYESGEPGAHLMLADTSARFYEHGNYLLNWLRSTRLFWLAKNLGQSLGYYDVLLEKYQSADEGGEINIGDLAHAVVKQYLGNYELVEELTSEYGFSHFFFWQPHLAVGDKKLTEQEQAMRAEMGESLVDIANAIYTEIELVSARYENLFYIADTFDRYNHQIWIDSWGHVTPEGNELLAREILGFMEEHISLLNEE
jgi:hypothetical protein